MAVINTRGVAALGSTTIGIAYPDWPDARTPPALVGVEAGNPRWFNDQVLIFQARIAGNYILCAWDSTNWQAPITSANGLGQNELYAGGNRWAATLATPSYREWALNFTNNQNDVWVPLDVDQATGAVAVWDRPSGITSIWTGTSLTEVTRFEIRPQPTFKDGVLLYRTTNGPAFAAWPPLVTRPTQVRVEGARAGCWHSKGIRLSFLSDTIGLVVHEWGASVALQLHTPGESKVHDNFPDIQVLPDGTLHVVSSVTTGERPIDFQRYVVNLAARTVNGQPRAMVALPLVA